MNVQNHVIVVTSPNGKVFVVGTNTRRGFTKAGAEKAHQKILEKIPSTFSCWSAEIETIGDILALNPR